MRHSMRVLSLAFALVLGVSTGAIVCAADAQPQLLGEDKAIADVVDHYVDQKLKEKKVAPAGLASDANFIRRVTLDLAGRIPTPGEVSEFVSSTDSDKRVKLVDRLLDSVDYAFHFRTQFDAFLMPTKSEGEFRDYLLTCFRENRPWDVMFQQMLMATNDGADKGALHFLKSRAANLDDITNDSSRYFFGVNVSCAKCHDHPLVSDWTQDHFYGMASFFTRTYVNKKKFLGERDEGVLRYKTTAGEERKAKVMFLTGKTADDPTLDVETDKKKKPDDNEEIPPAPKFSRREKLVSLALDGADGSAFFPRAIVNRVWFTLMGHGLVMPLDQMHSANDPNHPELLTWLARDMVTHKYDIKRLVRGLALSRTYQRDSQWTSGGDRPEAELFAVALPRILTPMQYSLSLTLATTSPQAVVNPLTAGDTWKGKREALDKQAAGFASSIETPGENFQVGVTEALLFSNNQRILDMFLADASDRMLGGLKGISETDDKIKTLFLSVYARSPAEEELNALKAYLASRDDRLPEAWRQILWSMITSSEFRFNY